MEKMLDQKDAIKLEKYSKSIKNFGAYSLTSKINFIEEGLPFLRAQNVKDNYIDWSNLVYIDESSHEILDKSYIQRGQVLLTMAGEYLGKSAVYDNNQIISSNQAIAKITLNDGAPNPYYISTFLNSYFGQVQINRLKTITGQPNINMMQIREIRFPEMSVDFQNQIARIVSRAHELRKRSRELNNAAEEKILKKLNIYNFVKEIDSFSSVNIKNYSETQLASRLDAEYYQPKYEKLLEKIISYKGSWARVRDHFDLVVDKSSKMNEEYNYVEISDVDVSTGMYTYKTLSSSDLPTNAKIEPKSGDILISKVRPNRGAITIIDDDIFNLIVSGAFTVLRSKSSYSTELLKMLFRSKIYRELLLKNNVGTSYPVIKDIDVLNIPIPLFDKQTEEEILIIALDAQDMLNESNYFLSLAKIIVEKAVEKGEEIALNYMDDVNSFTTI